MVGGKVYYNEEDVLEAKRAAARAYYYANRDKQLAAKRAKHSGKSGVSNLPVPVKVEEGPPMRKRPGKLDALIACHRAATFAREGDIEGAELWSRFAARMLEGKE